jgi:plasmid stabilization system protein ParE
VRVRWSPQAADHLRDIVAYIRQDSPQNAASFAERLLEKVGSLRVSPGIGRVIPEQKNPTRRELLFGSYRIMYHLGEDRVLVTGIIHGARDPKRMLRKPWDTQ